MRDKHEYDKDIINFAENIVSDESVFMLIMGDNVGCWETERGVVFPFWSNYEALKLIEEKNNHNIKKISLFEFLYYWIPRLFNSGQLVGINWDMSSELIGQEPIEIQNHVLNILDEDKLAEFDEKKRNDPEYCYEYFGSYSDIEIKNIVDEFNNNKIKYRVFPDDEMLKKMPQYQAAMYGGLFGQGVSTILTVHVDDLEKAYSIESGIAPGRGSIK